MPASRRARATTLMPRSWPSRPTLASTMRMGVATVMKLSIPRGITAPGPISYLDTQLFECFELRRAEVVQLPYIPVKSTQFGRQRCQEMRVKRLWPVECHQGNIGPGIERCRPDEVADHCKPLVTVLAQKVRRTANP